MPTWKEIWDTRQLDPARGSTLERLMAADGLDTGFGSVSAASWRDFVRRTLDALGLPPGASVFEVGCGAGAFLFELASRGYSVAGVDQSSALVGYAREAMPQGRFEVGDAASFETAGQYDAVVSCGVFLYFPSLEYAGTVLDRMIATARTAVAVLDVTDASRQQAAMAARRASLGAETYEARYRGLDHRYFERGWFERRMRAAGLTRVRTEDQAIPGYANSAFRFNAFGFRR